MKNNVYLNKNILIVDDSPIVRSLINTVLIDEGFQNIFLATHGKQAIDIFTKQIIDLVLLDYNMPDMNGEEVLNYLKKHYPHVIIIMLSDQTDRNLVISLMREADDYIVKAEIDKLKDELLHVFNRCFSYQDLKTKNKELMDKLSQRNKKLEEELRMARKLQKEIFPDKIANSDVFSVYILAKPSESIGGDFFDVIRLDDKHIGIFLGDICGHGLQAALLSFTLANACKTAINSNEKISAKHTIKTLNSILVKLFPQGSFAAGSYLVLNEATSSISFSGAFETPLLHIKSTNQIDRLVNGNIVFLGLVDNNMVRFEESDITLQPNEKIFIFTDGLIEVKCSSGERFGIHRIEEIIKNNSTESIKDNCHRLYQEVKNFGKNSIFDDVTIIGIEKKRIIKT